MKPFDMRLLTYARSIRGFLLLGGVFGFLRSAAIVLWCWCLSQTLALLIQPVLGGEHYGRVLERMPETHSLILLVTGALTALLVRVFSSWVMEYFAISAANRAKTEIRSHALQVLDAAYPETVAHQNETASATVFGRGLEKLDGYFSAYLPELILTVCATPFFILTLFVVDPVSAIVVVVVFPVIPAFMILIGYATQHIQKRQWAQLQRLSASFADVVSGITTLKIFRREHLQTQRIRRETEEYRKRTMKLLRITFLSGFVLDLAGTFSVALVAVTVGTRLISGDFPLSLALFVLLLLPEVFIPIRQVGVAFHASTEGLEAAGEAFELIERLRGECAQPANTGVCVEDTVHPRGQNKPGESVRAGSVMVREKSEGGIYVEDLVLTRGAHIRIGPLSFHAKCGTITVVTGPSGAGKSTLFAALLGFCAPESGRLRTPEHMGWVGQDAGLLQGTVAENVRLGSETATDAQTGEHEKVRKVLARLALPQELAEYSLGPLGSGLSGGQAQRVALARALYWCEQVQASALLLDEPSSALDLENEQLICRILREEAEHGRAVLVISHREALINIADQKIELNAEEYASKGKEV